MQCPYCGKDLSLTLAAREMGRSTSARKAITSRENGKKGGRPKRQKGSKP